MQISEILSDSLSVDSTSVLSHDDLIILKVILSPDLLYISKNGLKVFLIPKFSVYWPARVYPSWLRNGTRILIIGFLLSVSSTSPYIWIVEVERVNEIIIQFLAFCKANERWEIRIMSPWRLEDNRSGLIDYPNSSDDILVDCDELVDLLLRGAIRLVNQVITNAEFFRSILLSNNLPKQIQLLKTSSRSPRLCEAGVLLGILVRSRYIP